MSCSLCQEILCEPNPQHGSYGRDVESGEHVLYRGAEVVCVPALGPLNSHHILILPERHTTSVAAIQCPSAVAELQTVKRDLAAYNASRFDLQTTFFEHGTGTHSDIACSCVEHAHVHALGTNVDLLAALQSHYDFRPIEASRITGNRELAASGYYYYEHTASESAISTRRLGSQFFRVVYRRAFGDPAPWNWRLYHNIPLVHQIIANYRGFRDTPPLARSHSAELRMY